MSSAPTVPAGAGGEVRSGRAAADVEGGQAVAVEEAETAPCAKPKAQKLAGDSEKASAEWAVRKIAGQSVARNIAEQAAASQAAIAEAVAAKAAVQAGVDNIVVHSLATATTIVDKASADRAADAESEVGGTSAGKFAFDEQPSGEAARTFAGDSLQRMLGIWIDTDSRSPALIVKVLTDDSCCVEKRRAEDASLCAKGSLCKRPDAEGWLRWDRSNFGYGCADWPERFRISDVDEDLLVNQLFETWGDWVDSGVSYRRCFDQALIRRFQQEQIEVLAADDARPAWITHTSDETVLLGTGDGFIRLLQSVTPAWSKHVRDLVPEQRRLHLGGFEYRNSVVEFAPDGRYVFAGTGCGDYRARKLETSGHVACLDSYTATLVWSWHAQTLRNRGSLNIEALSAAPDGRHIAVGCNREPNFGDFHASPEGSDHLVYLETYAAGAEVCVAWQHPFRKGINALAHSPNSIFLAVGFRSSDYSYSEHVLCVGTATGHTVWTCSMEGQSMGSIFRSCKLNFSPGGRFVACAAWGHSSLEHDDFSGSACAEVDDDNMCTVTCIGVDSGQMVWRSKPIPDYACGSMLLLYAPSGNSIYVACQIEGRWFDAMPIEENFYRGAVVCLDARTGKLQKKAYVGLPETSRLVALKYCSDSHAMLAAESSDNYNPALKLYRVALNGPPPSWEGLLCSSPRDYLLGEKFWPSPIDHELVWSCILEEPSSIFPDIVSVAFKPLPRTLNNKPADDGIRCQLDNAVHEPLAFEEAGGREGAAPEAEDVRTLANGTKRKPHRHRQRKKAWLASVQVPTPASYD